MSALDTEAEIRKLAHTLGVGTERLGMLEKLPAADLRELRKQIGESLFQADRHHFVRVAAVSKAVPVAVTAKLTEAVLPPLLAARTAELLEPQRAVDLVGRISDRYLADVSAAMDASRCPELIAALPAERVARVALELVRRKEWVVIGGFVAQVSAPALAASVAQFDGEQLLRIGFVLDDIARLDEIVSTLTDAQLTQILDAAVELGLWDELGELLEHVSPERGARLAARYATADEQVRSACSAAAERGELAASALATLEAG